MAPMFFTTSDRVRRTPAGHMPKSMEVVYTSRMGGGYPTNPTRCKGNPATDRSRIKPLTGSCGRHHKREGLTARHKCIYAHRLAQQLGFRGSTHLVQLGSNPGLLERHVNRNARLRAQVAKCWRGCEQRVGMHLVTEQRHAAHDDDAWTVSQVHFGTAAKKENRRNNQTENKKHHPRGPCPLTWIQNQWVSL